MDEILLSAPGILTELTREFLRRASEEFDQDPESQTMACLYLATRSASLLCGMGKLLAPTTLDSFEVMTRGYLEARDLLMTFRFDEEGTRDKIGYWFDGKVQTPWKADHDKCNNFWKRQGFPGADLGKNWSKMTTLAHPTKYAVQNSLVCASRWAAVPVRVDDYAETMPQKVADYLGNIATLIVNATVDLPGLISLRCDLGRMPNIDSFRSNAMAVVAPILKNARNDLPPGSYRET